jgi:hypothetical protein
LRQQRRSETYAPLWLPPPESQAPDERPGLSAARACYVCKQPYTNVHRYYDSMCQACGDFNYGKREQTANLDGRFALVTGARVKIGFQASLKLLRAGAHVVATTRFPVDAAERYAQEPDYAVFCGRLQIHGIDLRHTPSVELFARWLGERLPRLDFILNNACQTVRRPAGFFRHLLARESEGAAALRGTLAQHAALCHALLEARRGWCTAPRSRSATISMKITLKARRSFQKAVSTKTASKWICARPTVGAYDCMKCRRRSCSKCSSSTPSHLTFSTRV